MIREKMEGKSYRRIDDETDPGNGYKENTRDVNLAEIKNEYELAGTGGVLFSIYSTSTLPCCVI